MPKLVNKNTFNSRATPASCKRVDCPAESTAMFISSVSVVYDLIGGDSCDFSPLDSDPSRLRGA